MASSGPGGGRQIASDEFTDLGLDGGALQHHAAVGPFDAAIAGRDIRLGEDHETSLEADLPRHPLDPVAYGLIEAVVDANHQMRRRHQVREAVRDQRHDFGERFARDQLRAELAGHRNRDVDRLGLHPRLDAAETRGDALDGKPDLLQRQRGAAIALDPGFVLRGVETGAVGARLGLGHLVGEFRLRRPFAALVGCRKVDVEQEFGGCGHQYTSSSSARFLVRVISPLAARSLARLTSSAWASSTSRSRTGPIAAMSSSSILPAPEDMLPRKKARTSSLALFRATPSFSLSILRISVWAEAESSLIRSSKVNISALIRSAASRLSSSSEVMKRVSVWRSKLLKISAITSWASRRRVCDRFDMNSMRSVCSTRSMTSFCTASIFSIRLTTSSAISSGRIASTRAACSGP